MPIDLDRIPERLIEAVRTGNLIPFVGAGVSRSATTSDSRAFPTWNGLLEELQETGEKRQYISTDERDQISELVRQGKFLMAAQALRSMLPPDVIEDVFRMRFRPEAEPGQIHRDIFKLKAPLIITTNYDCLLEDAYAQEYRKAPQFFTYKQAPEVQSLLQNHRQWTDRPAIFKIHGTVPSGAEAILSEVDYRNLLYREPGYRLVLSAIFVMKVVLMLGFSFDDPEIRLLLESLRDSLKYRGNPDYILLPKGKKAAVEKRRWREDFGIEAIEYEPSSPDHPELAELMQHLATFVPANRGPDGASDLSGVAPISAASVADKTTTATRRQARSTGVRARRKP